MSIAGTPREPQPPAPRRCPRCACELRGARICEVCGTTDFHGAGRWICFACGGDNAGELDRCAACNKLRVIACPACGFEGFHRDLSCESCGAARALYPTIERMLAKAARPGEPARARGLAACVVGAITAISLAAILGFAGHRGEASALGAGGGAAALGAAWLSRRRSGSVHLN